MLTPVILGLGLLLATAVIAYWSDNLGKKLGKKRVSLFNLRPRQTATLITIVSSWGIMLFTVVALLAVYAPLRNALFRYDKERAANRQLQSDNERLFANVTRLHTQQRTLRSDVKKSQGEARHAQAAFRTTRKRLVGAQRGARKAQHAERAARLNATQARRRADSARRDTAQAQRRAHLAVAKYNSAKNQLEKSSSKLLGVRTELAGERVQLAASRQDLKQTQKDADTARASAHRAKVQAFKAGDRLLKVEAKIFQKEARAYAAQARATKAEARATEAQARVTEAEARVTELETRERNLTVKVTYLTSALEAATRIVTGKKVVPYGVAFAARTFAPGLESESIRAALRKLFEEARSEVQKTNSSFSLALAPLPVGASIGPPITDADEILDWLTRYLRGFQEPVSVRVIAARDHAEGENEILAQMVPVVVRKALSRGQVLSSRTLDEKVKSDAQIFSVLLALVDEARLSATSDHNVDPPISRASPSFFAADTNEEIFKALRTIEAKQKNGARVSVRLVAADDLSTIESPRVKFEVVTPS